MKAFAGGSSSLWAIESSGKSAAGIEVPAKILESLGAGKRPPVRVTIKDFTYRSSIGSVGGRAMLPISVERRASAGVAAGDTVEVEIVLDTEPREVTVPPDLARARKKDADARTTGPQPRSGSLLHGRPARSPR